MDEAIGRIRRAIERGDFDGAAELWEAWSRNLAGRIRQGTVTSAEWAQTAELYRWSCSTVQCARAHVLDRLNTLRAASAYTQGSRSG
jgi:hypothetical protein